MKRSTLILMCLLLPVARSFAVDDHSDAGCADFTWDLSRELALMRQPPKPLAATATAGVQLGEHYALELAPQKDVSLVVPPERAARSEAPRAGVLRFDVAVPGRYRIVLTTRHWIDVVSGETVIPSADHQGRSGCKLLHKVVEFELKPGAHILQLSGQDDAVVGLAITGPARS